MKFNQRRKEENKPGESFITALYSLVEHCGYGNLHDEMIRDQIVVRIRNSSFSIKLQLDAGLTLDQAITQVRQAEAMKQQQPLLRSQHDVPVGAVRWGKGGRNKTKPSSNNNTTTHKEQQMCTTRVRRPPHNRASLKIKPVTDVEKRDTLKLLAGLRSSLEELTLP